MTSEEATDQVKHLVAKLAEARIRSGVSKRCLALQAGLDPRTIGLIERNERSPTLHTLVLISSALGADLSDLLRDRPQRRQP